MLSFLKTSSPAQLCPLENAEAGCHLPVLFPRLASFELRTHCSLKPKIPTPPDELLSFLAPTMSISSLAPWPPALFIYNRQVLNIAKSYCVATQLFWNWLWAASSTAKMGLEWKNASEGTPAGLLPSPGFSTLEVGGTSTAQRSLQAEHQHLQARNILWTSLQKGAKPGSQQTSVNPSNCYRPLQSHCSWTQLRKPGDATELSGRCTNGYTILAQCDNKRKKTLHCFPLTSSSPGRNTAQQSTKMNPLFREMLEMLG